MKVASLKGLDLDLNLKQHEAWLVIKASVEERGAQKKVCGEKRIWTCRELNAGPLQCK